MDQLTLTTPQGDIVPIPQTDAQVMDLLTYTDNDLLTSTLQGLYTVYKLQGHGILHAYILTVQAQLASMYRQDT